MPDVQSRFADSLSDRVRVTALQEIDDGHVVDFEIRGAERSVPSVAAVRDGAVTELVIRTPALWKREWDEQAATAHIESAVTGAGVRLSAVDVTPGLRREPRRSNLTPADKWYPHIEVKNGMSPERAARLVNRVAANIGRFGVDR